MNEDVDGAGGFVVIGRGRREHMTTGKGQRELDLFGSESQTEEK